MVEACWHEISRAVAAARSIASSSGLTADDAIVLHDSNKLALRLLPCDVFARVAPGGQEVAQFEVDFAQRLVEAGARWRPGPPRGTAGPRA